MQTLRVVIAILTVLACGILGAAGGSTTGVFVLLNGRIHVSWESFILAGAVVGSVLGLRLAYHNATRGPDR